MLQDIEKLYKGIVPTTIEDLADLGKRILRIGSKQLQMISLIIAAAKRIADADRASGFDYYRWVAETFDLEGSYRSKCLKVGSMFLDLKNSLNMLQFEKFFALDFDKQLNVSQLDIEDIPAFVTHYNLAKMTRAEVRAAVMQKLGRSVAAPATGEQLALPGFDAALDLFATVEVGQLAAAIDNEDKAVRGLYAGTLLLNAALDYELSRAELDREKLNITRAELLAKAAQIAEVLEQ